jgi:hypothetical protein
MAKMNVEGFNFEEIDGKLKDFGRDGNFLRFITEVVFSQCATDLMKDLDDKFSSKVGNVSYPRSMILGIYLYCIHNNIRIIKGMARECRVNNVLRIFTCGKTPSETTLKRFLTEGCEDTFKKIFLYSLLLLNDYDFLKVNKIIIDGTDALIRGSKFFKLYKSDIEDIKRMEELGLLFKNRTNKNKIKTRLNYLYEKFKEDKSICELIDKLSKNPKLYTVKIGEKLPIFEKIFDENPNKKFVSVAFPEATLIPTKKKGYGFGFNMQLAVSDENIVLSSAVSGLPNDYLVFEEILLELEDSIKILIKLVKKYGERKNYKEIENILNKQILLDSGYFSDYTLEKIEKSGLKALVMPKTIAIEKKETHKKNTKMQK